MPSAPCCVIGSVELFSNGLKAQGFRSVHWQSILLGCFVIGFLSQLADSRGVFTDETRAIGFCRRDWEDSPHFQRLATTQ